MKKFEGIVIVTDLDGTLLRNDKTVSSENIDAINYFKSNGGLFSIVTGRVPLMAVEIARKLDINLPFGCANGGGLYNHKTNEYEWYACLDEAYIEMVKFIDEKLPHIGIQLNTPDSIICCKENQAMIDFRCESKFTDSYSDYNSVDGPILKVLFTENDEEKMQELISSLENHPKASLFGFIRSDKILFEMLPKNLSKGTILNKIVELYHLDVNKTIAVGDYYNDVELIKAAKCGIAVENACNEAKNVASYITVSNNDHAIAKIIDDLEKGIIIL